MASVHSGSPILVRYQSKARVQLPVCEIVTCLLSCTVSEIWQIIWSSFHCRQSWGGFCLMHPFGVIAKFGFKKLDTTLYHMVWSVSWTV